MITINLGLFYVLLFLLGIELGFILNKQFNKHETVLKEEIKSQELLCDGNCHTCQYNDKIKKDKK